jgi:hypothetical protein
MRFKQLKKNNMQYVWCLKSYFEKTIKSCSYLAKLLQPEKTFY